jgi:type IV pilus assembly protein PilB
MENSETVDTPGRGLVRLLLAEKLLTDEQLNYARRVGAKVVGKNLIDIIVELGYLRPEQISALLQRNLAQIQTAPLLVDLGVLSPGDAAAALQEQVTSTEAVMLLSILLTRGMVEERIFAETLGRAIGMPLVDLAFRAIDRALVANVPLDVSLEHLFIPVGREDDVTLVAFADPLEQRSRDAAVRYFGTRIRPCLATRSAICESLQALHKDAGDEVLATGEALVEKIFADMITAACAQKVSTIHLEPMSDRLRVRFRSDGLLHPYKDFARELTAMIANRIRMLLRAAGDAGQTFTLPAAGDQPQVAVRACLTPAHHGEAMVLHLLGGGAGDADIAVLGMSPRMFSRFTGDLLGSATGTVLVVGAGGTTTATLQSIARYLNGTHPLAVVSVEEQVLTPLDGVVQTTADLQDAVGFTDLLARLELLDPDIVLIGNLPGAAACNEVLQAALRGRKLICGCAAADTLSGLSLLQGAAADAFTVAWAVNGIVAQRLVRRVCPECARTYIPSPYDLAQLGLTQESIQGARFIAGQGCTACNFTGTCGRLPVFELLTFTELIREAIIAGKNPMEVMRIGKETANFVTLLEDGLVKAAKGQIHLVHLLQDIPRFSKPRPLNELKRILGEHQ